MGTVRTRQAAVDLDALWNNATESVDRLCLEYAILLGSRQERADTFDLLKAARKALDMAGNLA